MNDSFWLNIERRVSECDADFTIERRSAVAGGSISHAWRIEGRECRYFVKTNTTGHADMFAAEAAGLAELADADAVRVPHPVCYGTSEGTSYLICEWLHCGSVSVDLLSAERFGHQLAGLHKHTSEQYGWSRDNTIGATVQENTQDSDWCTFWRERRLGFQLELAARNGFTGRLQTSGAQLMENLHVLLAGHKPQASLLHGDLWGGNWAADEQGMPVIFDPAVYYGDREADLAMTELFGGFPAEFYKAYNEIWPLDADYPVRKNLYNLYHILNHANLFGGGYVAQAEMMIERLLAEIT